MEYVLVCCRLLVGVVFVVSAVGKIRTRGGYASFRAAAGELAPWLPPVPRALVPPAVVAGELAAAVLLAVPSTAGAGFVIAVVLLAAFTVAIATAVRLRRHVICNCFGPSSTPVGPGRLVHNGVLLVASLTGVVLSFGTASVSVALEPAGVTAAAVTGVMGAALVLLADDMTELFRPLV
ncbi:MauE/DoxX family redox-associated membrane protein [Streptosporangium longisporum]|uniref:Methylamine utilisation protein MauE domain-containing protein n=1 Tax=Streptosporangium longisporum TaxID=46187 RepID=A0ABN3XXY0_9ACTN